MPLEVNTVNVKDKGKAKLSQVSVEFEFPNEFIETVLPNFCKYAG